MHGGHRPGAGRPKGAKSRKTLNAEAQQQAAAERVKEFMDREILTMEEVARMSPLDVIRHAMMLEAATQNWGAAASYAKELAPYQFAKLTSTKVDATVRRSLEDLDDDELIALAGDAEEEVGGEGEDGDCGADTGAQEPSELHDLHEA